MYDINRSNIRFCKASEEIRRPKNYINQNLNLVSEQLSEVSKELCMQKEVIGQTKENMFNMIKMKKETECTDTLKSKKNLKKKAKQNGKSKMDELLADMETTFRS